MIKMSCQEHQRLEIVSWSSWGTDGAQRKPNRKYRTLGRKEGFQTRRGSRAYCHKPAGSSIGKLRQENHEFKACLRYRVSSRQAWTLCWDPVLKHKVKGGWQCRSVGEVLDSIPRLQKRRENKRNSKSWVNHQCPLPRAQWPSCKVFGT